MYKLYIVFKYLISRITGKIHSLKKEIECFDLHYNGLSWAYFQKCGITYQKERYDVQKDVITTTKDGGGDCEDIARLIQVGHYVSGHDAYLVTMWGVKLSGEKFAHAFCIAKKDDWYYIIDYSSKEKMRTYQNCVEYIRFKYKLSDIKKVIAQDIKWRIKKGL